MSRSIDVAVEAHVVDLPKWSKLKKFDNLNKGAEEVIDIDLSVTGQWTVEVTT